MRRDPQAALSFAPGLGLHERAIAALLVVLADQRREVPTLDELARLSGADPGDLRRLFKDNDAVVAAAAEQALLHLLDACTKAVVKVDPGDALSQFQAICEAFLDWAEIRPVQFGLISEPEMLDLSRHPRLQQYLHSIRRVLRRMLERARIAGLLQPDEDIELLLMSIGAFVYGLARMTTDPRFAPCTPGPGRAARARHALRDFVNRLDPTRLPALKGTV